MKFYKVGKDLVEVGRTPPGIQLYTVNEEFKKNAFETLRALAKMGYLTIEFVGYNDIPAFTMASYLQQLGLSAPASHVSLERLEQDLAGEIKYAKRVGIHYIVIPYVAREVFFNEQEYKKLINSMAKIGKMVKQHGLKLIYHNHFHEFEMLPTGQLIIDRLVQDVGKDVLQLELDLFWVFKAGFNPVDILKQYKGIVPLIHIKDINQYGKSTEVGSGVIDYQTVFLLLGEVGVKYYFVEQEDFDRPPLESAGLSLEYLRSIHVV